MDLSIIIPSFNEGENVAIITRRIQAVLQPLKLTYEIWFMDDSCDNTPILLEQLSNQFQNVHYKHRKEARGLGSAVAEGFSLSSGNQLIVMDADLQHPPEILPQIIAALAVNEVVIPSRFILDGSDGGLNWFRKCVSFIARKIGQLALKQFRSISDCTSGCFGLHRNIIQGITLNPSSWKILMEILVKGKYQTIKEIPYQFMARDLGNSKMNIKEQARYLMHIIKLIAISPDDRRFYLFCFVGVLGTLVNLFFFHLFLLCDFHVLTSSVLSSMIATVHNFLWHYHLTWRDCRPTTFIKKIMQIPRFISISFIGIVVTVLMVSIFVNLNWNVSIGQLVGIGMTTGWGYFANKTWTWGG